MTADAICCYAFVFADLVRDRAVSMRKFLLTQVSMPFGAAGAVLFIYTMTDSQLRDIGGPIDLIVLLGVTLIGAIGTAFFVIRHSLFSADTRGHRVVARS